jgi:YebC/PmpR family DNA-binding regulatory protein
VRYEGYGPGGVAVLVDALTDNRNRTAADLRLVFNKAGGNLGESGCVSYLFDLRSVLRIDQPDLVEESLLEALLELEERGGPAALSYTPDGEGAEVIGRFEDLEALQAGLQGQGWSVSSWDHRWIANTLSRVDEPEVLRAVLRMLDAFEELDDVRSVTSNLEAEESLMETVMA